MKQLRSIVKETVGLMHEGRVVNTSLRQLTTETPYCSVLYDFMLEQLPQRPVPEDHKDVQYWTLAFVNTVDGILASKGYWAELDVILGILTASKMFIVDTDLSEVPSC